MANVIYTDSKNKVVIAPTELPPAGPEQVKVKTAYSYISAGTELTMLQMGPVNLARDVGRNPLGYSLSGTVVETGRNVDHVKEGDAVACVGAGAYHADEVLVARNLVVPIPSGCSRREAALAAMGCFALEGVRKAELEYGENVLVLGGGLMGQFVSRYAAGFAGRVLLLERNPHRLSKAGSAIRAMTAEDGVWDRIKAATAPTGVEKAFFCLGGDQTELFARVKQVMTVSPDNIAQGTVVSCGGATITVSLASPSGNMRILSSAKAGPGYRDPAFEAGADYPRGYVKWTVRRNVEVILQAIADGKLQVGDLITDEYPYRQALKAYRDLARPDTRAMAVLLTYEED